MSDNAPPLEFPDTSANQPPFVPSEIRAEAFRIWNNSPIDKRETVFRLLTDERMSKVYQSLPHIAEAPEQRASFFNAAFSAVNDVARYRELTARLNKGSRRKGPRGLKNEISAAASKLADLLEEAESLQIEIPPTLFDVEDLLYATRHGESEIPKEARLYAQIDAFLFAPPKLSECLRTVADDAQLISAGLPDNLTAAIDSQRKDPVWEYLRNLWGLLQPHGFEGDEPLAEILSPTTSVVMQLRTAPDVRNICNRVFNS